MKQPLFGDIIEESLADKNILKSVNIVSTRISPVTAKHKTPWLKQWTLHTIEVPEDKAATLADRLSHAIETEHSSWFIDFKNDATHYIIFPNKIFNVDRSQLEHYEPAISYGIKLGIPRYQLAFSPEISDSEQPES